MRVARWVAIAALCCGFTWSRDRDVATFKAAVYAPDDGTVFADGADFMVPVGSSRRKVIPLEGYPAGVRITVTATAVKGGG